MQKEILVQGTRALVDAAALLGLCLLLGGICVLDQVGLQSDRLAHSQDLSEPEGLGATSVQPTISAASEGTEAFTNSPTESAIEVVAPSARIETDNTPAVNSPRPVDRLGTVDRGLEPGGVITPPKASAVIEPPKPAPIVERPAEVAAQAPAEVPQRKESMVVEFFQTRAKAETVAFIVDCSGSMSGEKYDQVRLEIIRSIGELEAKQAFYVALFNQGFIPMFHSHAPPKMVLATPETNARIFDWLRQTRSGGGTDPRTALLAMIDLKPDIMYLLTDGIFPRIPPNIFAALKANSIIVHTIGFGSDADQAALGEISQQTGGVFRSIAPSSGNGRHLMNASPAQVRAELTGGNESQQVLAIEVSEMRLLAFEADVIELISSPSLAVRTAAYRFLSRRSQQLNLGPRNLQDLAAVATAQRYWREWLQLRHANQEALAAACQNADDDKRVVAAALAGKANAEMTTVLIPLLRDVAPAVRQAAHSSLMNLNPGNDFGPTENATLEEAQQAASRWSDWWDRKRREHDESRAAELLRIARAMLGNGSLQEANKRLGAIVKNYPDTLAAEEAKKLLPKSP